LNKTDHQLNLKQNFGVAVSKSFQILKITGAKAKFLDM
jgi:hypothetical protein